MRGRLVTEFLGTFFLMLIIGFCLSQGVGQLTPLAVTIGLTALVYMGGPISAAHYNPAVTIALTVEGAHDRREALPYIAVQFLGAILAVGLVTMVFGGSLMIAPSSDVRLPAAFLAEFLFTFALVLVILDVAFAPGVTGNSYYGVAIGSVVGAGAFTVGGISGGAFNPAVGLAASIVGLVNGQGVAQGAWIYAVAPIIGGLLAVPVFRLQYPKSEGV